MYPVRIATGSVQTGSGAHPANRFQALVPRGVEVMHAYSFTSTPSYVVLN
jgi:hypothetical protein